MSLVENSLYTYVEQRMLPYVMRGEGYVQRNNNFSGRLQRWNGTTGVIRNSTMKGAPDAIMLFKGLFIGLEFKSEKGKQSADQKHVQSLIESAGGIYKIIKRSEDFENLLLSLSHA